MQPLSDYDPRIVELYDDDNPDGADHEYYRSIANRIGARSILDVGCGTGLLTVSLTGPGRYVVGLDPSSSMITYARKRPGADQVTWIEGNIRAVGPGDFDLIVMTGNVAQHIPDPEWEQTLVLLRSHCEPGATLAFESRNPAARAWESWEQPEPTQRETIHGPLQEWYEIEDRGEGRILFRAFNRFVASGGEFLQEDLLTFRDHDTITNQLRNAGFHVSATYGDWSRTLFTGTEPVMIFEARAF